MVVKKITLQEDFGVLLGSFRFSLSVFVIQHMQYIRVVYSICSLVPLNRVERVACVRIIVCLFHYWQVCNFNWPSCWNLSVPMLLLTFAPS
jgi:hypothetical protein